MYDQLNTCTTKGLCEDTGFIVQICNQSMLSSLLVLIDEKNAFVIYDAAKKSTSTTLIAMFVLSNLLRIEL